MLTRFIPMSNAKILLWLNSASLRPRANAPQRADAARYAMPCRPGSGAPQAGNVMEFADEKRDFNH